MTQDKPSPTPAAQPAEDGSDLTRALAEARRRGKSVMADALRDPAMMSAAAFAALLGVTRATLHDMRVRHEVLGLQGSSGYRFPAWQIDENGRPFFAAVLPALFNALGDAWSVQRFLLQVHPELGGMTALETLRKGETESILAAARNVALGAFS